MLSHGKFTAEKPAGVLGRSLAVRVPQRARVNLKWGKLGYNDRLRDNQRTGSCLHFRLHAPSNLKQRPVLANFWIIGDNTVVIPLLDS